MQIFFDTLIIMALAVPLILLFLLVHHLVSRPTSPWHNHRHHAMGLGFMLTAFYLIISWGSFLEPYFFINHKVPLHFGLSKPVRIVFLADAQVGPYKRAFFMKKVASKVLAANPDLVIFGGDLVMNADAPPEREAAMLEPLSRVAQEVPFYAVLGNHEFGYGEPSLTYRGVDVHTVVHDTLEHYGIDVLVDEERLVSVQGQQLRIVGLNDLWGSGFKVMEVAPSPLPTVAVTHNPDSVYYLNSKVIDLLLTGHTHGGQIRLPVLGALGYADTRLPMRYYKGLSVINGILLYVTGGIGESGPRARLFNIPEITVIDID
ncbi:MAG TPA: hypothetical protein DDW36_04085 [Candidatus Magasanikbacteria bacterium]|nr:hypothetical protein [Candidatus Magasanikbacteria bacterium]